MQVLFTPLAERHLDALHAYITAHASEARADAFVGRIVAYCKGFTLFPQRGTRRDDLLVGLRTIGFARSATIAFMVSADLVLIEGVYYGGQDLEAVYREEET